MPSDPVAFRAYRVSIVGAPFRVMISPSRFRSSITRLIVGRLTPNRRASASSLGSLLSPSNFPARMSRRIRSKIS